MKKSDLKSGMVVKFRYWNRLCMLIDNVFCEVDGSGFVNLSSYDEDMCNINDGNQWDVVEVYKCKYPNLMSCFIENKLELIWQREKEIDWSKVPLGTRVRVWDCEKQNNFEGKFIFYDKEENYSPFIVFVKNVEHLYWGNCELIEELKEEKEITHEELDNIASKFCEENRGYGCKEKGCGPCAVRFICTNYNVTRK